MGLIRALIGGLIGGALGILIWVIVGYATGYEVGWIAWGVGFLVGCGVRYAAEKAGRDESFLEGLVAGALALGSVLLAKYLVFALASAGSGLDPQTQAMLDRWYSEDGMISREADQLASAWEKAGKTINWPHNSTDVSVPMKSLYPPDLWREAEIRWKRRSPDDQRNAIAAAKLSNSNLAEMLQGPTFAQFCSPYDLLWFALAAYTAFRIGVGTYEEA